VQEQRGDYFIIISKRNFAIFNQTTNQSNKNFFAIKKFVPNLKVIFENKHKVQREKWSLL
jgi:hypothetical protein